MGQYVIDVQESKFETEVLDATQAVLVDFWAPWCGPCRMIAPILEEIAKEYEGKVRVVKVNVDESPTIASKYGVRGIPTLILFKEGNIEATKVGAVSKSDLIAFLDENT
ncbi:MAG: hypothetical protein ACD_44C00176G0012 [uncultured bacterium]|nr:MAG: hypothetical protein ACD_44C00176G0012 [uncultured bacterium]OGT15212.1 MAG: thioredoxin [Gammaproteobacteria bacterium RIFCSPHIGHO2_02_FULL_38_33]OGT24674.1 MAG: thioredoxin [Gammaproteobacteria bacterium RIFCSPHIGHO2_12_38_15]OGT69332.1 MAG: thioredoxin [Gammaproteobacteria bacterium RIFCSPLOWO2_02_FULL_38_11]OGT76604.1 MAG: thioredoxin [Gammaproteobacteria bacterium RIFCSPLOWO2_12_FULL_38_14]